MIESAASAASISGRIFEPHSSRLLAQPSQWEAALAADWLEIPAGKAARILFVTLIWVVTLI